jgi:hypothetical protein
MLPIIVGRPWPNANRLNRTWEKVHDALGDRPYALDLDPTRRNSGSPKEAAGEFDSLFDVSEGCVSYYDLIATLKNAIPVLRIQGGEAPALQEQLDCVNALDKGLVLRLKYNEVTRPIDLASQVMQATDDLAVVIDAGWSPDLLGREAWATGIIQALTDLQPEVELVVCGSSFPDSFTSVGDRGTISVHERSLFDGLVRRHNAAALTYGDWGSTRPPSVDSVPMRNVPRIDLPDRRRWICFRREAAEGYPEVAARVVDDEDWPDELEIWGTYMIRSTAEALPGSIRSAGTAAAARINIHLHRQVHFDAAQLIGEGDEPFVD